MTFAVYLIHESLGFNVYLWGMINQNTVTLTGPLFLLVSILIIFAIFVICAFIEFIRQNIFKFIKIEESVMKISDKVEIRIRKLVNR